jgi:hypothetical protein
MRGEFVGVQRTLVRFGARQDLVGLDHEPFALGDEKAKIHYRSLKSTAPMHVSQVVAVAPQGRLVVCRNCE